MLKSIRDGATRLAALTMAVFIFNGSAWANVKLPALFSDHMVLQQGQVAPVWGWADKGEDVSVSVAGQTQSAKAGDDGKWMVRLVKLPTGGPYTLEVKGKNTLTVKDVLIGEVWLGSGQSNMGMTVSGANNLDQEKAEANLPLVRVFTVGSGPAKEPQADCRGKWVITSPESVGNFSATLYFFGKNVHQKLKVPMGLINSSVGGTPIENWIDKDTQHAVTELKPFFETREKFASKETDESLKAKYEKALAAWTKAAAQAKKEGKSEPRKPTDLSSSRRTRGNASELYNGKIAPLIPYGIRGAIWYQGEANTSDSVAEYYRIQLPLLVNDWRKRWGQGDFPFAWVQLPNYSRPGEGWPLVREAMLKTLALPNTGMAIAIDIGEEKNIHPKNKQEVGRRLALWALGSVYGQSVPSTSGPLPAGHEVRGGDFIVRFSHADGGLTARGGELTGFVIAGKDGQWHPAKARIDGATVLVSSPEVKEPVAVRYAWKDWPACNLYNGAGLPASPFRTDSK